MEDFILLEERLGLYLARDYTVQIDLHTSVSKKIECSSGDNSRSNFLLF